jgi:hypothetical protein
VGQELLRLLEQCNPRPPSAGSGTCSAAKSRRRDHTTATGMTIQRIHLFRDACTTRYVRINPPTLFSSSATCCEQSSDSSFISARPRFLPLPEGEGGVRGKATLEQHYVSALKRGVLRSLAARPVVSNFKFSHSDLFPPSAAALEDRTISIGVLRRTGRISIFGFRIWLRLRRVGSIRGLNCCF